MEYIQNFNFHTHTERCGHAEKDYNDEGYVKEATGVGIKFLAFTDHIPLRETKDVRDNVRMEYEEIDDYLKSITNLQKKYEDIINIETGFEFEYNPNELQHILQTKSMVDKMILGQHYIFDKYGNIKYFSSKENLSDRDMIQYICLIDEALKRKIPDIIAHPDLFLKYRQEFGNKEEFITRKLCQIVEKSGVPMEINLNEIYREYVKASQKHPNLTEDEKIKTAKEKIKYPHSDFWRIASEYKIKVLYGIDAHLKGQIENSDISYKIANEIIGETIKKLNFVDYKFNEKIKYEEIEL